MQRTIKAKAERLMAEATAHMVGAGASVEGQNENSITFAATPGMAATGGGLSTLVSLFDFGAAMSMQTANAVVGTTTQRATLVALPGEDGETTTVTIAETENVPNNLLRFWFVADVLREPLPNPLMTLQVSYHKVLIWNDRVEAHTRRMVWKLRDTIHVDDIQSVETNKRLVTVRATDGRETAIKALAREDAEKAKAIVEARLAVYATPSLA